MASEELTEEQLLEQALTRISNYTKANLPLGWEFQILLNNSGLEVTLIDPDGDVRDEYQHRSSSWVSEFVKACRYAISYANPVDNSDE